MSKRSHKALASATVMSLILTSTLTATNVQAASSVERLGGGNREATATSVAKSAFPNGTDTVVLVNGYDGYGDSVSATPLAKALNAPILLTDDINTPSADLIANLKDLKAKKIVIVGGEGVVPKALADKLASSYKVERIGGNNRYETNANVAKKVLELTGEKGAFLVNGQDGYADALSVASIAATKGMPILFANKNEVPAEVKEAAKGLTISAVGGKTILPDAVVTSVGATRVAGGGDRFETNIEVLNKYKDVLNFDNMYMAYGGYDKDDFADALVASAAAAKTGAPVVLSGKKDAAEATTNAKEYLENNLKDSKVYLVGGEAALEKAIEDSVKNIVNPVATDLKVESVSAINAKEIQVKFNKPIDKNTVIDDKLTTNKLDDKLKADTIYIDGTAVTWAASLSEDGRILTMQPDGIVTSGTNHKVEINKEDSANFVKDLKGEKADAYLGTVQIVDKTRATLDKFEKINPDIVRVYFSEPVQNPAGDLTATYADGTSAAITAKPAATDAMAVNYVDLDISAAKPGEEATVTFKGIKDYANNVSTPISVKVKKDVDEVKPVIQSVKATSVSSFEIKASKAIKTVDVTKIKVNGTALADGTSTCEEKAVVDTKDNTKIVVTLGDAQSGSVPVEIGADALEDFASTPNKNDVYKTILSFNADKTAPQVTSTKVINKDNNNYLVVNFDEEIKLAPSDLTFKYVDKMGVTQEKTVPAANVNVDGTTKKAIEIKLVDNATPAAALPSNVEYTVEIPGGYVKDNFGNSFVKKNIVFTLGTVSNKLELVSGNPIVEKAGKPGVIEVKFAKAVNIDSATNVANYIVEDAQVEKVKLVENDESTGAKVEVYLKDNTVELSGNYNVTVKGVKGYKENVTEMDSVTKNILLNENVRPTVKEVSIDKFDSATSSTTLTITFTEAVKNADGDANDYSIFIDGKELTGDHVKFETETTGSKAIVVTIDKDLSADITSGKSIKLVAKDTLDITDTNGNTVNADTITIK
ncbi:N-acetylmuramoyl-L-alanine amidase LytC precursor [Clostridium liquoris]|uniref:N-acetylmuramoyl-L-alanine amidase LytC n=1 Tax=Clostridium liquoris TaxID=1289519 RepID=A0A2T0B3Y3_9CLOT|nr:cell wall-binding repeat-containing protein [Clostridium liquoris]PRR78477.1 N-acetylmuramoyl-L-alanine amidase LytC precursor [Clostridium liquoris]